MKRIVLIDGYYWLFSSYFATAYSGNYMTNSEGIPTNGVFGFARRLEKVLSSNPDRLLVALDSKGPTFRSEMLEEYKGTRKEPEENLVPQFDLLREYLNAYGVPHYELKGYEGDDIIGTMSMIAKQEGYQVDIYTGDKDMLQLVSDHVHVYKRNNKTKEDDQYTIEAVKERYGIEPDQIRDFLGLMGDSSDNIPGIKGVGEKTALKLLNQYGTIENIDEHKENIKGKLGEKVRDSIEVARLSKAVATIKRDVPIDINMDDCSVDHLDYNSIKDFYIKYNMNSLLKEMAINKEEEEELSYEIVSKMPYIEEDSALIVEMYDEKGNHNYHKSIILGFGIYNSKQSYYINYEDACKDEGFLDYLKDETRLKYSYNVKSQIVGARWKHIEIKGMSFDLQLATYILNPSLKDEIKYICEYYDYSGLSFEEQVYGKGAKRKVPDDLELLAKYVVSQAKAVYELREKAIELLKEENQYELYENIEMPITYILTDMEYQGTKVDLQVLKELGEAFDGEIKELEEEIYIEAGEKFNILSPKQLGVVLFEDMGLPIIKRTKSGYSTSQEVLEQLEDYPIVPMVERYRFLTKLQSTYIKGLSEQIFADGKIHTIYNQALTQTGRLSSVEPNLQNIPVRVEEGKRIRKAFVASYDELVSFDYSQIELRILAHLADVKKLQEAFNLDKDIHSHTASLIFNVDEEEVTSDMRRQAKAINFGIIYGMGEFRLSKEIGVNLSDAKIFIDNYFKQYPEIKTYMNQTIEDCKETGYVSTILNRKRYIPTINDRNYVVREQAKRFAMNSPIQGSGADILKLAMINIDKKLKERNLKSKMILQVHDELIFDVYEDELEEMMSLVQEEMENCIKMKVRLKADGYYASNWFDLK